jgi:hypothetical protein
VGGIFGTSEDSHLSPSRSPPDIKSALGLLPRVGNTIQSTKCANSCLSTTLNFCKSPGCRQGFLVTRTSIPFKICGRPSPSMVTLTAHSPSFKIFQESQTPNNNLDLGIKIRHRCSSLLFNVLSYSELTRLMTVGLTDSRPSSKTFSASSGRFSQVRRRNPVHGSTIACSRYSKCSCCFCRRTVSWMPRACKSRIISSFR